MDTNEGDILTFSPLNANSAYKLLFFLSTFFDVDKFVLHIQGKEQSTPYRIGCTAE